MPALVGKAILKRIEKTDYCRMESFPLPPKKSLGYVAAGIAQVECTRRCFRFQELIEHVCKTKVCTI